MKATTKTASTRKAIRRKPAPALSTGMAGKRGMLGAHSSLDIPAMARQLRSWSDSVLGIAGAAADVSVVAAKALLVKPGQRRALERAGRILRGLRESTGMSLNELGNAIDLKDPTLLDLVENGKVALPFEIILRLASVLGRNDPISFVMRFTRSYSPDTWKTLEALGVGRLAVQAGREREFANIYRGNDDARRLDDDEFAKVLEFTRTAFDLALSFRASQTVRTARTRTGRGAR
jgi:transcriptional regulator with XRE-family HTH domain